MITSPQLLAARLCIGWSPARLAGRAKVPLGVAARAEDSPGEPAITVAELNALVQALRAGGASFPLAAPEAGIPI